MIIAVQKLSPHVFTAVEKLIHCESNYYEAFVRQTAFYIRKPISSKLVPFDIH